MMMKMKGRQFAEYISAQDDALPRFSSDRERVAKWIVSSSSPPIIGDDDYDNSDDDDNSLWSV